LVRKMKSEVSESPCNGRVPKNKGFNKSAMRQYAFKRSVVSS
jgi:hypothetical protein